MFSNLIKILIALIGLSPTLLFLEVIVIYQKWKSLSFYLNLSSISIVIKEFYQIISIHFALVLFLLLLLSTFYLIIIATTRLPKGIINVKSLKPADNNIVSILSMFIAPIIKMTKVDISDILFFTGLITLGILYSWIMKNSNHYNLTLKIFLGYNNYEVQTTGDVTYLVLTKKILNNKNLLKEYVFLTDHMLIDVTK